MLQQFAAGLSLSVTDTHVSKKGVYVDGHERDDVREYRIWFLDQMATYERYVLSTFLISHCAYLIIMLSYRCMTWYTPDSNGILQPHPPALRPGEKEIIALFHDESSFHGYDMPNYGWYV